MRASRSERGAIAPGTGLILKWARKGRPEEGSLTFCQIVALVLPHRSVVARRFRSRGDQSKPFYGSRGRRAVPRSSESIEDKVQIRD